MVRRVRPPRRDDAIRAGIELAGGELNPSRGGGLSLDCVECSIRQPVAPVAAPGPARAPLVRTVVLSRQLGLQLPVSGEEMPEVSVIALQQPLDLT